MKMHKHRRDDLRATREAHGEGDGQNPRDDRDEHDSSKATDRKTMQWCKQVRRALDSAFFAECGDPALAGLRIAHVEPAPDAGRLRAWLEYDGPPQQAAAILLRVERAKGLLRSVIAARCNRKRVPELIFALIGPDAIDSRDQEVTHG